jgi:hypothetical protein
MAQEITPINRDLTIKNSVDLIFPLQTEITIEIAKLPSYIAQLTKLFEFYNKQLAASGKQVKDYNISYEIAGLLPFLTQLDTAIKASNLIKPIVASDPEKISVTDYEFITMRILPAPTDYSANTASTVGSPTVYDARKFSDASLRQVLVYNKIDYLYLTNKTYSRSMAVLTTIETTLFGISPATLSLLFNIDKIVNEQINSPIPAELLLCRGKETALSNFGDGFSIFGFDIEVLSSKVLVEDFLNAYIHPEQEIVVAPRPPIAKGCTQETKVRIGLLRASMNLYDIQIALAGFNATVDPSSKRKYEDDKKEFIQLTRLCPDTTSEIALFEGIKDIDKLGKLFTDFLERFNIACIVDEAIKCVMPQIPCDQILRDLTVDNFEQRLQIAFPHQKKIIEAISLTVRQKIEDENARLAAAGQPQLDPAGQAKAVLDGINLFIDLEALCKIDIEAIIALIKALFNFKFPSFNIFDWQFNFKIDFDALMLQLILDSLLSMISQVLDELVGCDALDGLIAGIINSNIEAPTGLYGDIASMFGGDFDFSNTSGILKDNVDNFLTQSTGYLEKIIKFETKLSNGLLGSISTTGSLGLGLTNNPGLVGSTITNVDAFGGIVRASNYTTGGVGLQGFTVSPPKAELIFDATRLSTSQDQKDFLKEIGQFHLSVEDGNTSLQRISDDSIVNLLSSSSVPGSYTGTVSSATTQALVAQTEPNDVFSRVKIRNKNRHILNALVTLNEREGTASMLVPQKSLSEEIKDYVKTCFSLLSPSEAIDLVTANASQEVKLTIDSISRIRFPLLHSILKYPDRHAILFASFGKLTGLDSIGPRLQILSSSPAVKQTMVDPNVCLPFASIYDFRKALIDQTLPRDMSNKLMDDLIEDDRNRANKLVNSLAKKIVPAELMTNASALAVNKTPDGKQIEEIDNIIGNTLSNIFDQIKISFDNEIEAYPKATAAPVAQPDNIYEFINKPPTPSLYGFKELNPPRVKNDEFIKIQNITRTTASDAEDGKGEYYPKVVHKDKTGELFNKAFENYSITFGQQPLNLTGRINNINLPVDMSVFVTGSGYPNLQVEAAGNLASANDTSLFTSTEDEFVNSIKETKPKWVFKYAENNNTFSFQIRTSGQITTTTTSYPVNFAEKIVFSGTLNEQNQFIKQEIQQVGGIPSELTGSRQGVFYGLMRYPLTQIGGYLNKTQSESDKLRKEEISNIYKRLVENGLLVKLDSKLLKEVKGSEQSNSPSSVFLNLIDFSPLPTADEKARCIDVHLLQTQNVIKRIKEQINSTTPENIVNTNSRINTRYSDGKPGHVSEKIMTGLADIFIRTSVIHNIFKGLFIFDQYGYTIDSFSLPETIYSFFENRVKMDIKNFKLADDFGPQIERLYELYKNEQEPLIPQQDNGSNKLRSLIKYHISSVLDMIKKSVDTYRQKQNVRPSSLPLQQAITAIATPDTIAALYDIQPPINTLLDDTSRRNTFFNSLPKVKPYSNFWKQEEFTATVEATLPPAAYVSHEGAEPLGGTEETAIIRTITTSGYSPELNFTSNIGLSDISGRSLSIGLGDCRIIIEEYVRLDFKKLPSDIPVDFKRYQDAIRTSQANGIVNLDNFEEIMKSIVSEIEYDPLTGNKPERTYLFKKDREDLRKGFWFNSAPKYGIRMSIIKSVKIPNHNNTEFIVNKGFYNGLILDSALAVFVDQQTLNTFDRNTQEKRGLLQTYDEIPLPAPYLSQYPNSRLLSDNTTIQIIPVISEEIELPEKMYDFDNTEIIKSSQIVAGDITLNPVANNNPYSAGYVNRELVLLKSIAEQRLKNNPIFDLMVNFCLPLQLGPNFALFNNLIGMANEPVIKLLDGTKQVIKNNFTLQKNSGNFKNRTNNSGYEKQKKATTEGPSSVDLLKAATTIPIGILKGLATTVDPNIFLADKIVLAGKMGFIQPKYRRVQAGEVVKIQGSTETKTITSEESGVAYDGYYKLLESGELEVITNPTPSSQGMPINELTIVADVENGKIKKVNGKTVTMQGNGKSGVPWDIVSDKPVDDSVDQEDISSFDIRPSTVIFPGEKINIPYSVASLSLAPFPIFSPGLTSYNIAMPFGPLFLALEPLILETPQFKASIPRTASTASQEPIQPGVITCQDNSQEE